jgi:hypothetical protein
MTTNMLRQAVAIVVTGIAIAAAAPSSSAAGPWLKISGAGTNATGTPFQFCFQYDVTQRNESAHAFAFSGTVFLHEISYAIPGTQVNVQNTGCEPYEITTNLNTNQSFQLITSGSSGFQAIITIPFTVPFTSLTALPTGATSFQPTGTFTLQNLSTGAIVFSGTITGGLTVSQSSTLSHCFEPPISMMAPAAPAAIVPQCPEYACPPRQKCCFLTRLFSRRCQ